MHIPYQNWRWNMHPSKIKSDPPFKLTTEQQITYTWIKEQGLNVDDETLNYWVRKYPAQRLKDVIGLAQKRMERGQQIRNVGGWIHKLLIDDSEVPNKNCRDNLEFLKGFMQEHNWKSLNIYEKHIKDKITGDDLSLTIQPDEFQRALEAVYSRTQL